MNVGDNYRDVTFRGDALDGEDLRGAHFLDCAFVDIAWTGRNLVGSTFENAHFEGGDISRARFAECDLINSRFLGITAQAASFQDATFDRTELQGVDLTGAKLIGVAFSEAAIYGGIVTRADFSFASFRNCGFNSVHGEAANFSGSDFLAPTDGGQGNLDIELPLANFTNATLRNVTWPRARLEYANFARAKLDHVVLANAELDNADFTDAVLQSVILDGASLVHAEFGETDRAPRPAEGTLFFVPTPPAPVRLRDVGFRSAQLTNARFNGVVLERCDFRDAYADAAEFMATRFVDCVLDGMNWTDIAPGWLTTDDLTRRAMLDVFLSASMALPYVPLDESYDIVEDPAGQFRSSSWAGVGPTEVSSFVWISERLSEGALEDGFALNVTDEARGASIWTYACTEGPLSIVVQLHRRGLDDDAEDNIVRWDEMMRGVRRLFERRFSETPGPALHVEFSESRGVAQWRWIQGVETRIVRWDGDSADVAGFFWAVADEAAKL